MVGIGTKLTLEEFLALPDGDVYYEFVDGEAVPKVSPKKIHSSLQGALCRLSNDPLICFNCCFNLVVK